MTSHPESTLTFTVKLAIYGGMICGLLGLLVVIWVPVGDHREPQDDAREPELTPISASAGRGTEYPPAEMPGDRHGQIVASYLRDGKVEKAIQQLKSIPAIDEQLRYARYGFEQWDDDQRRDEKIEPLVEQLKQLVNKLHKQLDKQPENAPNKEPNNEPDKQALMQPDKQIIAEYLTRLCLQLETENQPPPTVADQKSATTPEKEVAPTLKKQLEASDAIVDRLNSRAASESENSDHLLQMAKICEERGIEDVPEKLTDAAWRQLRISDATVKELKAKKKENIRLQEKLRDSWTRSLWNYIRSGWDWLVKLPPTSLVATLIIWAGGMISGLIARRRSASARSSKSEEPRLRVILEQLIKSVESASAEPQANNSSPPNSNA